MAKKISKKRVIMTEYSCVKKIFLKICSILTLYLTMVVNVVGRIILFNLFIFPLVCCPLQTFTFLDPNFGSKLPGMLLQDPWYMLPGILLPLCTHNIGGYYGCITSQCEKNTGQRADLGKKYVLGKQFGGSHNYKTKQNKLLSFIDRWANMMLGCASGCYFCN